MLVHPQTFAELLVDLGGNGDAGSRPSDRVSLWFRLWVSQTADPLSYAGSPPDVCGVALWFYLGLEKARSAFFEPFAFFEFSAFFEVIIFRYFRFLYHSENHVGDLPRSAFDPFFAFDPFSAFDNSFP